MGCYSFANHVLAHHPEVEMGFDIPSLFDALGAQFSDAQVLFAPGCSVEDLDRSGIAEAVEAAAEADVAIVVVGDRAGLFGRGTVGEGNDVESLELPGVQRELVEAVVATGTPVVMVLLTGRPYAIGWALDAETAPRAVLQAFFPGEEGGAGDRVDPLRRDRTRAGACPSRSPAPPDRSRSRTCIRSSAARTRSRARAAHRSRPFGFGLSYTSFSHADLGRPEPRRHGRRVHRVGPRAQRRLPRGHRRRAAVRARRLRIGHAPRRSAAGLRAGLPWTPARRPSSSSTCRRRGWRSRRAPASASSSPVRSSCGSEPRAPIARRPARSSSPDPFTS